jgi:NAD(P)-dependent dehydrogenase (short-subunit alcohol dehydrogenase family)
MTAHLASRSSSWSPTAQVGTAWPPRAGDRSRVVVFAADLRESVLRTPRHGAFRSARDRSRRDGRSSLANAIDQVEDATDGDGLNVLVNVAGILVPGPVEAVPDKRPVERRLLWAR